MTNQKQEQLKKLLVTGDFKEESYNGASMQDLIILKKSAETMKEKNLKVAQNAQFFAKREEFFRFLVLRRLQKTENLYAIFSQVTRLPYAFCDPDTCNDQIWIFSSEAIAQKALLKEQQNGEKKLTIVKLENKHLLMFYISLYPMGINEILIDRGANMLAVPLESLVRKPDNISPEKQLVMNPELVLTAVYFSQQRALPKESIDMENLRELEEEMLVNLQRGKLLVPVQVPEGSTARVQAKDMKFPVMKLPNGDMYQPVCSDPNEFQKFSQGKNLRAITVECEKLKGILSREAKGVLLNPGSVRLVIPREKLE